MTSATPAEHAARVFKNFVAEHGAKRVQLALPRALLTLVFEQDRKIKNLEARLNSMPAVSYAGVYTPGTKYMRGMLTTYGGALWHAQVATSSRPGTDDTWRLCVKAGRDGRDAR